MKTFATLFVCPLAALGAVVAPRQAAIPAGSFTAGVWRPVQDGDVFFFGNAVNANGGKFWINKDTSASCPEGVENLDCSVYPGTDTIFLGGNDTLSLNVAVPGGQQVYIDVDGSLSYTQSHTADKPEGSITTGFKREQSASFGAPVNLFNTIEDGWLICPVGEGEPREKVYQVFAGLQKDGCFSSTIRTYSSEGPSAWQYE